MHHKKKIMSVRRHLRALDATRPRLVHGWCAFMVSTFFAERAEAESRDLTLLELDLVRRIRCGETMQ